MYTLVIQIHVTYLYEVTETVSNDLFSLIKMYGFYEHIEQNWIHNHDDLIFDIYLLFLHICILLFICCYSDLVWPRKC